MFVYDMFNNSPDLDGYQGTRENKNGEFDMFHV
jgi:hypothetical protein